MVDYNIDHYTISDMLTILGLPNASNINDIYATTNKYLHKSQATGNIQMFDFFIAIVKLLLYEPVSRVGQLTF